MFLSNLMRLIIRIKEFLQTEIIIGIFNKAKNAL